MRGTWIRRPAGDTVVVFIHGLFSSNQAWRHENGTYWPELLAQEVGNHIGLYTYEFRTGLLSTTYQLGDIVDDLAHRLKLDGVLTYRRLVFICHSMGGIVARRYIVREAAALVEQCKEIGLFLIGSPTLGAKYANLLAPIARLFKHAQVEALRFSQSNSWLVDLDRDFLNLKEARRLRLHGKELVEDRFVVRSLFFFTQIVEPFSAARYFAHPYKVPDSTHYTIAKVDGANAIQHRLLLAFLEELDAEFTGARGDIALEVISANAPLLKEKAKEALRIASADLLSWDKALPDGSWIDRPERRAIDARFDLETSSTVLLGEPGSGKSALLSRIAEDLLERGAAVFALKADFLSADVRSEADLQRELHLPTLPSALIADLAKDQAVYILLDQLDALANQLDLRSERLNVILNLIRRIAGTTNVHILLSARSFEFNHDVRLRAVDAESIALALPSWEDTKRRLSAINVNPDGWPERARDVVRIPQALKTYLELAREGKTEPYITYQAMLEQLWNERIALAAGGERLVALASELANRMAEEEALWLAASRFDNQLNLLNRLEASGFVVRSQNKLSVAFSHQTIFDYVLARNFVQNVGLLSSYVLERQDSLFVRAKMWSGLSYLREAEVSSYERELRVLWQAKMLRRHLRTLVIEFLGQVKLPNDFEKTCMSEVLASPDTRLIALKAIAESNDWFAHFSDLVVRGAMLGIAQEAGQALRILVANWQAHPEKVTRLIEECWASKPDRDTYSWAAFHECPTWNNKVEGMALAILGRTPISISQVSHTAQTVAVDQPEVAVRLVKRKLETLLVLAKDAPAPPPFPEHGTDEDQTNWYLEHGRGKHFDELLEASQWHDLPALAEAAPETFLLTLWPWYVSVFSEVVAHWRGRSISHAYRGKYVLEFNFAPSDENSRSRERPVLSALQVSVEKFAAIRPATFVEWSEQNADVDILAVQQLIARGYEVGGEGLSSQALVWLLKDERRFQLGTTRNERESTLALIRAAAPRWSVEAVSQFESAVGNYNPAVPAHLQEPEQRKRFLYFVRATRKELLQAVGIDRITTENRELVATERRALGDRPDRVEDVEGGWIGAPMTAAAMSKAKDRDILNIFNEIPDKTDWDHPKDWMRGGNIQLSREFAQFARAEPERGFRIIKQFEPLRQERAAGYALEVLAEDASNHASVTEAVLSLHQRGFCASEFREAAASAVEKIANRKGSISEELVDVLDGWLGSSWATDAELSSSDDASNDTELNGGSILWSDSRASIQPGGNFSVLSALASILLNQGENGRDRYVAILDRHLDREYDPKVWKALLYKLRYADGPKPQVTSQFLRKLFAKLPSILASYEGVTLLGFAQRWDDELVFDVIANWPKSTNPFLRQAFGELVGLVATAKQRSGWIRRSDEIIAIGTVEMKIGLAHSAVNMWRDVNVRGGAAAVLVQLLTDASRELLEAVMDIFRVVDDWVPDAPTIALLAKLADERTDLGGAPPNWVVERLHSLLPHEGKTIAAVAKKLVSAWRTELSDFQSGAAMAAPQLTDLALTLHRMGGELREAGVDIFEAMIEIDAYGARDTLAEIDGRFGVRPNRPARPRLSRRRKGRSTKNA